MFQLLSKLVSPLFQRRDAMSTRATTCSPNLLTQGDAMSARFYHWSASSINQVYPAAQPVAPACKPKGLWYSVGQAWADWCTAEEFPLGKYAYEVVIDPSCRILYLHTPEQLQVFLRRFGLPTGKVDWAAVAIEWDGMELNYQALSHLRWQVDLVDACNCNSGCLWNPRATKVVAL